MQDQRPIFFEGQYLSADDLKSIVESRRVAEARHSLAGHTWGISLGLSLTELSSPGAPQRVEVVLQPGFAWDGFGRTIVVKRPTRLSESLFNAITFNPVLDNPAALKGRLVPVWLAYDEFASRNPSPGFEACITDDQRSRVGETFRFVVGAQSLQRADLEIGTNTVPAEDALRAFDPNAMRLHDTSVPHQTLPFERSPPSWLIPVGFVRWVSRQNDVGYFAILDLVPADKAADLTRSFRRYVGVVAEYIEAADRAIVLHRRGEDPFTNHRFGNLIASGADTNTLLQDLVWVDGHLRVAGDAKLCAGELQLLDADGVNQGTELFIDRAGDDPVSGALGNRELRAVIGADDQTDNRFIVGPRRAGVTTVDTLPNFVVVSDGNVGIGRQHPETRLNVVGTAIRLQNSTTAPVKRIDLRTDGPDVSLESSTSKLQIRSFGAALNNQVLINSGAGEGNVGIGTGTPQQKLHVEGDRLRLEKDGKRLDLRTDGSSVDVQSETHNLYLHSTGPGGANNVFINPHPFNGNVGIGTSAPLQKLQVNGRRIRLQSSDGTRRVDLRTDGSHIDLQTETSNLYLRSTRVGAAPDRHIIMNPRTEDGYVGIGTTAPQEKLHVAADFLRVDGQGDEQAVLGAERNDAIVVGARNAGVNFADMRKLSTGLNFQDANAWLTVFCRGVTEISDEQAKTNVRAIDDAVGTLRQLRGVTYDWVGRAGSNEPAGQLGLIAQEVETVVPQAVTRDSGRCGITYTSFIPLLIEAVKELKNEVDALHKQLDALKSGSRKNKK